MNYQIYSHFWLKSACSNHIQLDKNKFRKDPAYFGNNIKSHQIRKINKNTYLCHRNINEFCQIWFLISS